MVINFNIDASQTDTSIDNLMVFKYFEDTNMLLPIETTYNEITNTVSTHVDEVGTYCLIDVEKWFEILEETPAGNYYEGGENEPANIVFCLDTRSIINDESFNAVKEDIKAITENAFDRYSDIKVYVYYQQFGSDFKAANKLLTDSKGNNYFTGYEEAVAALDKLETYMIKNNYWAYDFVEATQFMIDNCDEKIIAMYHITADDRVMGGINKAKKLTQTVQNSKYTTSEGEEIQRIYVSTLCPNDAEPFDTSSYAYELATLSGGIAATGYVTIEDTEVMTAEVESVEVYAKDDDGVQILDTESDEIIKKNSFAYSVQQNVIGILGEGNANTYKIISSAGLTKIELTQKLTKGSTADEDNDGIYDWDEVNTELVIKILADNNLGDITYVKGKYSISSSQLPTYKQMIDNYSDLFYVRDGLTKWCQENDNSGDPYKSLEQIRFLPIHSNPIVKDSDDDGFLDNAYVNYYENVDEKDKITYEWVKQSDEYFNVSDPNPLKKEIIWQWPVVSAEAVESYVDNKGNTKYRSKVDENGEKLVFKDEYKCKNLQASFVEKRGSVYHKAIDITTHSDDTYYVIAAYDGTIYKINDTCEHISSAYGENEGCGCGGGWGNYIAINSTINNDTFTAVYAHLEYDSLLIKQGYVKAGDVIAVVGSSGNSEAVHLDFSIRTGSYIEIDAETGNKNKKIGKKCYDPIIFSSYCENNKLFEFELNHFIDLPKKLKKMCSTPSDGCTNYYPLIEEYYKIEMDEKV